jgi:hypothetical protein
VNGAFVNDWIGVLAFFPLWLVASGTMFGIAYGPKQAMGVRGQKFANGVTLMLSIAVAAGALTWMECASYIHLPFARPACPMIDASLQAAWVI